MRVFSFLSTFVIVILAINTVSHAYLIRYDGPYEGRVIDGDTGKPIEGVVVLGVWNREEPNVAGVTTTFYDATEVVTDKNGEFKIQGLGLKIFSLVAPMDFVIFKAGYENIGYAPWESLKVDKFAKEKIKWEGKKAIFPIKKWSLEERRNRWRNIFGSPRPGAGVPNEKQELLRQELEKEDREIGLRP